MTPQEFKRIRGDYSLLELSKMIGVTTRTIRRYEAGQYEINPSVQILMRLVDKGTLTLDTFS